MYWTPTTCKDLCSGNCIPMSGMQRKIINKKGTKTVVSGRTQGSPRHQEGSEGGSMPQRCLLCGTENCCAHTLVQTTDFKGLKDKQKNISCPWPWTTDLKYGLFYRMAVPSIKAPLCLYLTFILLRKLSIYLVLRGPADSGPVLYPCNSVGSHRQTWIS